jgi:hypothetical protein
MDYTSVLESKLFKIFVTVSLVIIFIIAVSTTIAKINTVGANPTIDSRNAYSINLIDKDKTLYSSTAPDDFKAIQDRLKDYITYQDGIPTTEVDVQKVDYPIRDGSVTTITLDIPSLNQKGLVVTFDSAAQPFAIFSVPSKSYTVPLYGRTLSN